MILTDSEILKEIDNGNIVITPFDKNALGSNSYDVHLGNTYIKYLSNFIDSKRKPVVSEVLEIPENGLVIKPGEFYLMSTLEYTETHSHVPFIEGKSSSGRMGLSIHATAGKGDVGFCGFWTLEVSTQYPVKVYPGMPIGQLIYFEVKGACINPYNQKKSAKYNKQGKDPVPTSMYKNFEETE